MNYPTRRVPAGSGLPIGGNATIGKGLCAVRFSRGASPVKEEFPNGGYEVSAAFSDPGLDDLLTADLQQILRGLKLTRRMQ